MEEVDLEVEEVVDPEVEVADLVMDLLANPEVEVVDPEVADLVVDPEMEVLDPEMAEGGLQLMSHTLLILQHTMFLVRHARSGQQRKVPEVNHDLMGSGQILQVEQVHSQLEKITTSLRQCNFQSYMISVKTFFFFNNLKKKENFVGYSSNNHFISNINTYF